MPRNACLPLSSGYAFSPSGQPSEEFPLCEGDVIRVGPFPAFPSYSFIPTPNFGRTELKCELRSYTTVLWKQTSAVAAIGEAENPTFSRQTEMQVEDGFFFHLVCCTGPGRCDRRIRRTLRMLSLQCLTVIKSIELRISLLPHFAW